MISRLFVLLFLLPVFVAAPRIAAGDGSVATPAASPSAPVTPPPSASPDNVGASPVPLMVSGQMVDLERGFVVFASGDALRLAPNVLITDANSGKAPTYEIAPGIYALATLDPNTGVVSGLQTSLHPVPAGTPVAQLPRRYVIVASQWRPNPDLAPPPIEYRYGFSKTIGVRITVSVPSNTPYNDTIYMATDTSGWNPQAVKMQRLDGLHFRINMDVRPGTSIHYLFTRGTWNTVERDRAGLQRPPRDLMVPGGDVRVVDATVYRWADLP